MKKKLNNDPNEATMRSGIKKKDAVLSKYSD